MLEMSRGIWKIERKWPRRGGLRREDGDGRKLQQSGLSVEDGGGGGEGGEWKISNRKGRHPWGVRVKKGQNRLKERKDPSRVSVGLTLQQSQSPAPDPELLNTVFRSQARSAAMLDVSAGVGGGRDGGCGWRDHMCVQASPGFWAHIAVVFKGAPPGFKYIH